jgi:hypothetical protein
VNGSEPTPQNAPIQRAPALRLRSYILRIWERCAKEKPAPAKRPAVLPFVHAQGKRPWKTAPRLHDLIDLPKAWETLLRQHQPSLDYPLLE